MQHFIVVVDQYRPLLPCLRWDQAPDEPVILVYGPVNAEISAEAVLRAAFFVQAGLSM